MGDQSDPLGAGPNAGVWAHLKRGLGNLALHGTKQLAALVKTWLKRMQFGSLATVRACPCGTLRMAVSA